MRVILTGGGTGGHIYPGIAIYHEILQRFPHASFLYVGKKGGMEEGVAEECSIDFNGLQISGVPRKKPWLLPALVIKYCQAIIASVNVIRRFRPDFIVGTGGYVCFPVCLAAGILGVPYFLHEQNALPGKANLFLAKRAKAVFISFQDSAKKFKTACPIVFSGLPVRDVFFKKQKKPTRNLLGFHDGEQVILVTGGSRGSQYLNQLGLSLISQAMPKQIIVLIAGKANYLDVKTEIGQISAGEEKYRIIDYARNIDDFMCAADLVICRAGATTLSELCALGKASVLVPYPRAAENHQFVNAATMEKAGAAKIFQEQTAGHNQQFVGLINELCSDKEKLHSMETAALSLSKTDAAKEIVDFIEENI